MYNFYKYLSYIYRVSIYRFAHIDQAVAQCPPELISGSRQISKQVRDDAANKDLRHKTRWVAVRMQIMRCPSFLTTFNMIILCISLTGCGFKPLFQEDQNTKKDVQADLQNVKIALIKDRFGQLVRNRLLTLMHPYGENASPDYELVVQVSEVERGLTIQRDYIGERFEKGLKASFSIRDLRCDKIVFSERTEFYTSYSMGSAAEFVAYYSTVAEEDAVERLTQVLADDIYTRVASVMRDQKETCVFDKTLNKMIADSANEDSDK